MNIRYLRREEIPLLWQIDRREIVENVFRMDNGELRLEPDDIHLEYLIPD